MTIAVLGVCTLLTVRSTHRHRPTGHKSFGHFTARQIFAQTAPICREVLPGSDDLQLEAVPFAPYYFDGSVRRFWEVDCLDGKREELAFFWWDAETGRLDHFTRCLPCTAANPSRYLTGAAAAERARHWIERVGWGAGSQWQVCRPPQLEAGEWIVLLGNRTRRIRIHMDAGSGIMMRLYDRTGH
jgi:hypothetical protein